MTSSQPEEALGHNVAGVHVTVELGQEHTEEQWCWQSTFSRGIMEPG